MISSARLPGLIRPVSTPIISGYRSRGSGLGTWDACGGGRFLRPRVYLRVHPAFHRQRRVLVALPAAVHGAHYQLRPARLDWFIGGFEMPLPWVQSINLVFIIVLSGVFAAIWTKLGHRQPATPLKFAAGTMTMGLAFLLFLPFVWGGPNRPHCWR